MRLTLNFTNNEFFHLGKEGKCGILKMPQCAYKIAFIKHRVFMQFFAHSQWCCHYMDK